MVRVSAAVICMTMPRLSPQVCHQASFTRWERLPEHTDLLYYEGLHGAVVTDSVDIARHVDLLIGKSVPITNLEWIQKIHRDTQVRGYSMEAVQDNDPAAQRKIMSMS